MGPNPLPSGIGRDRPTSDGIGRDYGTREEKSAGPGAEITGVPTLNLVEEDSFSDLRQLDFALQLVNFSFGDFNVVRLVPQFSTEFRRQFRSEICECYSFIWKQLQGVFG